jgi:hypothetical protein
MIAVLKRKCFEKTSKKIQKCGPMNKARETKQAMHRQMMHGDLSVYPLLISLIFSSIGLLIALAAA